MGTEHLRAEDGSKQEHPAGGRNTNYICGLFKGLRYNLTANWQAPGYRSSASRYNYRLISYDRSGRCTYPVSFALHNQDKNITWNRWENKFKISRKKLSIFFHLSKEQEDTPFMKAKYSKVTLQLMTPRLLDYSHVYTGETHSSITERNTLEAASTTLGFPGIPYSIGQPGEESQCYDCIKT